jgi:hypothetical protein
MQPFVRALGTLWSNIIRLDEALDSLGAVWYLVILGSILSCFFCVVYWRWTRLPLEYYEDHPCIDCMVAQDSETNEWIMTSVDEAACEEFLVACNYV